VYSTIKVPEMDQLSEISSTVAADYFPAYLFLALAYSTQRQITDFSRITGCEMELLFFVKTDKNHRFKAII